MELLVQDDESDGAPPRSSIDLARGTAFIVLPQRQSPFGAEVRMGLCCPLYSKDPCATLVRTSRACSSGASSCPPCGRRRTR
ncbi:DUF6191 domain-containing protein [Streptomyces flavofungini]|uniref:DUF6191 domain-containing protein n=1 Tax=Streptomyces flavofungini TaxID=68200 RepID=UPI00339D97A0